MPTKNKEEITDYESAIRDIRDINHGYEGRDDSNELLLDRLHDLERELLNQHYDLVSNREKKHAPRKRKTPEKSPTDVSAFSPQ